MGWLDLLITYGPAILKLIGDMQPIVAQIVEKHGVSEPAATKIVTTHYVQHGKLPTAEEAWMNRQNATG